MWKKAYAKKKALKRAIKESSPDALDPTTLMAITSHRPMWEDFDKIAKNAKTR